MLLPPGQGTPGLGNKVCPPGAGRERESEAGLSPPITFFLRVTSASITRFLLFDFGILILISFFDSFWFHPFLQGVTWVTFSFCSGRQLGLLVRGKWPGRKARV